MCEIIYTLTLTLPKSTCTQGRSRSFPLGPRNKLPTHWQRRSCRTPSSNTARPCLDSNPRCFSKRVWGTFYYSTYVTPVLKSRLYLQSKHMTSPMPSHFQTNVSDKYSIEETCYPTALNYLPTNIYVQWPKELQAPRSKCTPNLMCKAFFSQRILSAPRTSKNLNVLLNLNVMAP